MLSETDRRIIDALQGGFPLASRPFARVAAGLCMAEDALIEAVTRLREDGVLSRFGPMYDATALGGAFTLCALAVPEERFDAVARLVNAYPEVAHNYRREHALNMWFVLACTSPEEARKACERIEAETGLQVFAFPKEKEFFVELHLPV